MNKPECDLIGQDGNVFNLIGQVKKTLIRAGLNDQAKEMQKKAIECQDYDSVLNLFSDYVDLIWV